MKHYVHFRAVTFPCASKPEATELMRAIKRDGGKPLYTNTPIAEFTLTERRVTLEKDGSTSVNWYPLKDSQQEGQT